MAPDEKKKKKRDKGELMYNPSGGKKGEGISTMS